MASPNTDATEDAKEDPFLPFQQLYSDGDDEQKLGVIRTLPHLVQCEPKGTILNLLLRIQQELPRASSEFNLHTSQMFKILIDKHVSFDLMQSVYKGIESRNAITSSAWVQTLVEVANTLTESQIKNDVLPIANRLATDAEIAEYRQESCIILGTVAVHRSLGPLDVKKEILPLVHGLCQDFNSEVRSAMCIQLPSIAKGLGRSLVKSYLLPNLIELSADDCMNVRAAAIEAVVKIFPHVNEDTIKNIIVPLVRQLCERSLQPGDTTAIVMAKEIGKLLDGLVYCLNESDATWFLFCFKELTRKNINDNLELIRHNCANSLPSLTLFVLQVIPNELKSWQLILYDLVTDESIIVRQTMAENMHKIARILGCDNAIIEKELIILLKDDEEEVLQMLVPNLGSTLELFFQRWGVPDETTLNITEALHKCQTKIAKGLNWRLLVLFIQQMESLPNCISSDFIYRHFTPEVLNFTVQHGPRPVRIQAAHTFLIFLRFNTDNEQKKLLREELRKKLALSDDCYSRIIFVKLCALAMDIFSEKYFKNYFFKSLINLANDPIANIRLCVVTLLPRLKQMIHLPMDITCKHQLDGVIKQFQSETDRDVKDLYEKFQLNERNPQKSTEKHQEIEEKRRQDEENWINVQKQKATRTNRTSSAVKGINPKRKSIIERSILATKANVLTNNTETLNMTPSCDMNFLEQHFYIDAGVNLPPTATKPKTTNITDDEKVNLRKKAPENKPNLLSKSSSSNPGQSYKRYSSIISTNCLKNQTPTTTTKNLQRRSLDFSSKDPSRIPVSSSLSPKKEKLYNFRKDYKQTAKENGSNKKLINLTKISINTNNEFPLKNINGANSKSLSQLPVFVGKLEIKK